MKVWKLFSGIGECPRAYSNEKIYKRSINVPARLSACENISTVPD